MQEDLNRVIDHIDLVDDSAIHRIVGRLFGVLLDGCGFKRDPLESIPRGDEPKAAG